METIMRRVEKNKALLRSTEDCIQSPGINHKEKEHKKERMHVYT